MGTTCHTSANRIRPHRGVTLIELLVTLAVAAILLGVAVPSFQGAMARNRVAGLTNELAGALNLARSEAVKRGVTVTVCKSADTEAPVDESASPPTGPACSTLSSIGWDAGWLIFVDGGTQGVVDASDIRLKVGHPSLNVTIQGGTSFANSLSYLPNGVSQGSSDPGGSLEICSAPEKRTIEISVTGRIRVTRGSC